MKMNIKGLVFVGFAAAVFASAANAADGDNKKVTSYQYTENTYEKKANKVQTLDPNATAAQKAINYPSQAAIENLVGSAYTGGDDYISVNPTSHEITTTARPNVIEGVQVNGTGLTPDSNKNVNVTVAQGSTDGTIAVNGSDVSVKNVEVTSHKVQTVDGSSATASVDYPSVAAVADLVGTAYTGGDDYISVNPTSHEITTTARPNVIEGVQVNGTGLTPDSNKNVNVTVAQGSTDGTIAVNGSDVSVKNVEVTSHKVQTVDGSSATASVDYPSVAAVADLVGTAYTGGDDYISVNPTSHEITTTARPNVIEGITVGGTAQTPDGNKVVALGSAAGLGTATTISSSSTNNDAATALAVYNFLNNGAGTANCSDTNPCAFVLGDGAPEWKPIQQ